MHLILKCVLDHEIPYMDNLQYLTCQIDDIVLCDSFIKIKDDIFGFGKNHTTNNYGLFLINKFVIVDFTNYVSKELYWTIFKNQAFFSKVEKKFSPGIFHRVSKKSVSSASICMICGEYLIGLKLDYPHCAICSQVFHSMCYDNHKASKSCHRLLKLTNKESVASLQSNEMSITDWTNDQVLQWLCTVHFFRLVDLFQSKRIEGSDLFEYMSLSQSEILSKNNTGIMKFWSMIGDNFYRESLYLALATLMGRIDSSNTPNRINDNVDRIEYNSSEVENSEPNFTNLHLMEIANHNVRETTYSTIEYCYYCQQVLLGIQKQGLHCVKCRQNFHKICALQKNITLCVENNCSNEVDIFNSTVFGVMMKEQPVTSNGLPLFIKCCIEELERRYSSSNSQELLKCYSVTGNTEDTIHLKNLFSLPVFDQQSKLVGLSDISDLEIAKLIKLYLKELPEPLFTYGFYHSLIESVHKDNDDRASSCQIHSILIHLPLHNRATLQFLSKHFQFICSNISDINKIKVISKTWSCIFSKSLIWPSQVMIKEFCNLKDRHQRLIQLVFEYKLMLVNRLSWPLRPFVEDDLMNLSQSLDRSQLQNLQSSIDDIDYDINAQDWYWSDTTKEEVNEFMGGLQDGYFMVRDSSDKSQGGVYTLTIRKDGENKLIRILYRNNFYGFQEPCKFPSVSHLIRYYQTHRLSDYNDQLNLTLKYPCSKRKTEVHGHSNDCYQMENEELINLLYSTMKEYSDINTRVDHDTDTYDNFQKELDEVTKCLKGIDRIQNWCTNHSVHIMNSMQSDQSLKEGMRDHLRKCLAQLNTKLKDCDQVVKEMNVRREMLSGNSTLLLSELSINRPKLKKLNRLQSSCIRQLKDRGVPDELFSSDAVDNIDKLCEDIRGALNENNPINIRSNWFIENISREEAVKKLMGKPHGTFLIRRSREPDKFALDIMVDQTVQHCRILYCGGKYGFIENDCLYQSLDDLVKTFHMRTLAQYNARLTTNLAFPINIS